MPQPFNYGITVPDPLESSLQGYKVGMGMRQLQDARLDAERKRAAELQLQTDLGALARNPNAKAQDYASMIVKYPALSEHFKRGWEVLDKPQREAKLAMGSEVYAAINAGQPKVAIELLQKRAEAARNSGDEREAVSAETLAKFIESSPETARTTAGLALSALMGPEKFAETFTKLEGEGRERELQPHKVMKDKAEAEKAAVAAKFAERVAVKDLEKLGWDITKIQEDIKIAKENARIAAMNSAIGREANAIRRGELKLKRDEAVKKQEDDIRTKAAEVESARTNIDNFLNTADRVLATPKNVMSSAMGPTAQRLPTLLQSTADFEALMENFDAQAFISQLPSMKGLGALSDAEGRRLSSALQSFSLKQSPERLVENVQEAQRLLQKGRANLAKRYGVPDNIPDTPAAAAATSPKEVEDLIKKYAPGFRQ